MDNSNIMGIDLFRQYIQKIGIVNDNHWTRLGVFSFQDTPLFNSLKIHYTPESILYTLAEKCVSIQNKVILLININRLNENGPSSIANLESLLNFFNQSGVLNSLVYFGNRDLSELTSYTNSIPKIKIDLNWISNHREVISKSLVDASPFRRSIKLKDIPDLSNISSISAMLTEKLGPPSFSDEVSTQIQSAGTERAISEVAGLLSVTSIFSKGFKYGKKLYELRKKRDSDETKQYFDEWQHTINEQFSDEKISDFIADSGLVPFLEILQKEEMVIILDDTQGSTYGFLDVLLLKNIKDMITNEASLNIPEAPNTLPNEIPSTNINRNIVSKDGIVFVIDSLAHICQYDLGLEFITLELGQTPSLRLIGYLSTHNIQNSKYLESITNHFLKEKGIIFDINAACLEPILKNMPSSLQGFIWKQMNDIATDRQNKKLRIFSIDRYHKDLLKSTCINPSILDQIKQFIQSLVKPPLKPILDPKLFTSLMETKEELD